MSETPEGAEARRVVDELEEEIVDVDQAQADAGVGDEEISGGAEDASGAVPGSPEPPA